MLYPRGRDVDPLYKILFKFKFIQKSCKKKTFFFFKAKETGPQVARANLGGPDLQLLKDKISIIIFITIKLFRTTQTEFREGKEITRRREKELNLHEPGKHHAKKMSLMPSSESTF